MSVAIDFLDVVLPTEGFRALFVKSADRGFHKFFETNAELAAAAMRFDQRGFDTYFCTATLKERGSRKGGNAAWLQSLRLDLDVGEGRGFATAREAAHAINNFAVSLGMPYGLVFSGSGLHAYFSFDAPLLPPEWLSLAYGLRQHTQSAGLPVDSTTTIDVVRVLRLPGTHNHKTAAKPEVRVIIPPARASLDYLSQVLLPGGLPPRPAIERATSTRAAEQTEAARVVLEVPAPTADAVADACPQLARMRQDRQAPHGLWYQLCSVFAFCSNGAEKFSEWSAGHPDYSEAECEAKIVQCKRLSGAGTCVAIEAKDSTGLCRACQWHGKINTPISAAHRSRDQAVVESLAAPITDAPDLPLPELPGRYEWRSGSQLWVKADPADPDDRDTMISPRPIYLSSMARREVTRQIECTFRYRDTREGWRDFTMPNAIIAGREARTAFARHMPTLYDNQWRKFQIFVTALQQVMERGGYRTMYDCFGWKPNDLANPQAATSFVVGEQEYFTDGSVLAASLNDRLRGLARQYTPRGDPAVWSHNASQLFMPGLEPHGFVVLCALAAPLMALTGVSGAPIVNIYGLTGTLKTLALVAASTAWCPFAARMTDNDTPVAKMIQVHQRSHLPVHFDESRDRDPVTLARNIMTFSGGKDRARGSRDGGLLEIETEYNTIITTTSNSSIRAHIGLGAGQEDDAPAMRVWEARVADRGIPVEHTQATKIGQALQANCGHAGRVLVREMITRVPRFHEWVFKAMEHYQAALGGRTQHRYYVRLLACCDVAARVAGAARILDFSPEYHMAWALENTQKMITARAALEQTSANMLGFYLANNQNNVLVVVKNYIPGQTQNAIRGPNGAGSVHMRLEVETKTLWIAQREMRAWFIRNGLDIERAMAELEQENIIVSTNRKITLSAGVVGYATGQTPVYEVDLAHPAVASELRSLDSGRESIGRMVR